MAGIVEWVKNYSMVCLLLMAVTSVAAKKEYRKYVQLFVEIVLVITILNPLLRAAGKSGDLFEKISYDSFWQGLNNLKMDQGNMEFLKEGSYQSYYEKAIASDVKLLAENAGYAVVDVTASLNEAFEIEEMELKVAKQGVETVVIGTLEKEPEDAQLIALREKVASYYQIPPEKVVVLD